ncbi:hypothetical protein JCM9140_787 [Halalkalibacter wakoensis JCM 9140]|uniref:Lipoprotein n=1 Tax=Halalkalibacter wakoensis JCM 9140 TaxID=1236970 RepID=W4Q0C3_9BACI|nr:hypothetical protein [Halalkalibacter wakoensis]GAE24834.1 hypothetical protein JCM9140_787 [Halalkalibacter wakoensis JCM 9140]
MRATFLIMVSFLLLTGCDSLRTSISSEQTTMKEIVLTENEQVIFSMLADQIFYFDFTDDSGDFQTIEVGVDYFHYGNLVESLPGMTMATNDRESELRDERARFLFTMNKEEKDNHLEMNGTLKILFDSGSSGSSTYSFTREGAEVGALSRGYLIDRLDHIPIGEKIYVAYYVENSDSFIRAFDHELALKPNDDYEHVLFYYVKMDNELKE